MLKWIIAVIVVVLATAGGLYHHFIFRPVVMERITQQALDGFSRAVKSQDCTRVSAALGNLLTDSAQIHLKVTLYSFVRGNDDILAQDFDKASFITFVDNTLYSLQKYSFQAEIREFDLGADAKTAEVISPSQESADGDSLYAGTAIHMHFGADTVCTGTVVFENKKAMLDKMNCKMTLHSLPKSGQESKLRDPAVLQQFLVR